MELSDHTTVLARFERNGAQMTGLVRDNMVSELESSWKRALAMLCLNQSERLIARAGRTWRLSDVRLLAPLETNSEIYCVGLNYIDHREEASSLVTSIPADPIVFLKSSRAVVPDCSELLLPPSVSREFDWEVELGVVIGKSGRSIRREDAWEHIAGYTVVNDVTARDLQVRHVQWHLGKNVQSSTPIGPWVAARQDGTKPDFDIRLCVNGVLKQAARTSELIFDIPTLIERVSNVCELQVGDVIATGTPAGVGFKRTPPEFLQDGDVVIATISQVGELTNVVSTKVRTYDK